MSLTHAHSSLSHNPLLLSAVAVQPFINRGFRLVVCRCPRCLEAASLSIIVSGLVPWFSIILSIVLNFSAS
ncbi:hypothetical protein S245_008520, partial [Arachis hypogaea]